MVRVTGRARRWWAMAMALALIQIMQAAWLVPTLSARTDMVIAGNEPPPSIAHAAYSTSSLVKLGLLFAMGTGLMASRGDRP